MSQIISLTPNDTSYESWQLQLPDFNQNFIDEFKQRVPSGERSWEPQAKVWIVSDTWKDFAIELALKYFPQATVEVGDFV